jgi:methylated-DNA-protein-cysteine methyltransferase-like protein
LAPSEISRRIIELIQAIPPGKVASYAQIANLADCPNGARRVARILHSCSSKYALPWHRVIKNNGSIALTDPGDAALQAELLRSEGILVSESLKVDIRLYGWQPA